MPNIDVEGGLMLGAVVLLAIVGVRFLIAYANASGRSDALRTAFGRTGQWSWALVAGAASAAGLGLVQFGDLVAGFISFLVGHPYFASNLGVVGLGAGAFSGFYTLTTSQFVGIALLIVGAVMFAVEADEIV